MTIEDGTRTRSDAATDPASLDGVFIEHFTLKDVLSGKQHDKALCFCQEQLAAFGFTPDSNVSVLYRDGEIVITTNPAKQTLLRSAEELLYRQDETKQDHACGILTLLNMAGAMPPMPQISAKSTTELSPFLDVETADDAGVSDDFDSIGDGFDLTDNEPSYSLDANDSCTSDDLTAQ